MKKNYECHNTIVCRKQIGVFIVSVFLFAIYSCAPTYDNLLRAVENDDRGKVLEILSTNPDLKHVPDNKNPLVKAVESNNRDMAKILLTHGIDVNIKVNGVDAVFYFLKDIEMMELFVKGGCDLRARDKTGYNILHWAIDNKMISLVKLIIESGGDVNEKVEDRRGFSPLMLAVESGSFEMVKMIGDAGADVGAKSNNNNVPLLFILPWTKETDLRQMAEYLLLKGADVNTRNEQNMTPLHFNARTTKYDYIKFLLEHGADANARDSYGNLAIDYTTYITKNYSEDFKVPEENYKIRQEIEQLLRQYMSK
ncbi:MAG: ankyrin repeat domain-containing protein [Spirochaetaceae bacterium]|nr:MAG: ankyrin repeat domain-containing protein [Spirochaetaceae bacterium]